MKATTTKQSIHQISLIAAKRAGTSVASQLPSILTLRTMSHADAEELCSRLSVPLVGAKSEVGEDTVARESIATLRSNVADAMAQVLAAKDASTKAGEAAERVLTMLKGDVTKSARLAVVAAAATGNPIADALMRHYSPGTVCPFPLAIFSPPSFGKSHGVAALGKGYDLAVTHGCCNNPDEWEVLVGGAVAAGADGFILADGKLTEAVRAASKGQTVLLFLDEVLRWPEKVQELLLTFLQPATNKKGEKVFRLTTRNRDKKTGTFEVLEAPTTHLHVVAAANLTHRTPVEAFWSRFEKKRFDFSLATAEAIANSIATSYGISDSDKLAKNYASLISATRTAVISRTIKFPADFRLLERACAFSDGTALSAARYVADKLVDNCASWDADTGDTLPESVQVVTALGEQFLSLGFTA